METRAYKTKVGKVLQVMAYEGGFCTFQEIPKHPGEFEPRTNKEIPVRPSFDEAQYDLDEYAAQMEYNPALPLAEPTTPMEPGEAPPSHPVIAIHAEALSPAAQEEMERLDRRLEQSARDLISKKNEKAAVNSRMNGEIKEVDEEIESILSEMDRVREMDAPGAQRTLFDSREPKEVEKGACTSCEHDLESCHYDDEHNARACTICGCLHDLRVPCRGN